ncbi:MAG: metal-sensing transcriptional repressor [Solobacterium sp.]|nr:metal-sensing transcriptional repressor [Solobacterium sp.]
MSENENCCAKRHKNRSAEEQKALLLRLKKAEGQIRGIEKMVEENAWCPDIMIQVSAVTSALNSFNKELLACHLRSCITEDLKAGNDESIDELVRILPKLMK